MIYPLVSIIIPTYNRSALLKHSLESALAQEDVPVEVLVCDDGSNDDTAEMISSWNDERVIWIEGPRSGRPAVPRNRGIRAAKGEWLSFLDDDDTWVPHKLRMQLAAASKQGVMAVCSNAFRLAAGGNITGHYFLQGAMPLCFGLDTLAKSNQVICSSACVHRSVLELVKGFPEDTALRAVEDFALWLRVACVTPWIYVDEALVVYKDVPTVSIRMGETGNAHGRGVRSFIRWGLVNPTFRWDACKMVLLSLNLAFIRLVDFFLLRYVRRVYNAMLRRI